MTYTRRSTVEAHQFIVGSLPWPVGVVEDESTLSGYSFRPEASPYWSDVSPGDYVVEGAFGSRVVRRADFEEQYEV